MSKMLQWLEILVLVIAFLAIMEYLFGPVRALIVGTPDWQLKAWPCLIPIAIMIFLAFAAGKPGSEPVDGSPGKFSALFRVVRGIFRIWP